jgi:hypothetical protein
MLKTQQRFVSDDYFYHCNRLLHLGLIQRSYLDLIQVRHGQKEVIW